jgi:hypothetical protein
MGRRVAFYLILLSTLKTASSIKRREYSEGYYSAECVQRGFSNSVASDGQRLSCWMLFSIQTMMSS